MLHERDLKDIPIFGCLSEAQRTRIAESAADLRVQTGEWLIREGEVPWFFVFLEGCLEIVKEYGGARTGRSLRYGPGDFFGETPILLDSPTIASLRAVEPSRVVRLDRTQFKELIDSSPECSSRIVKVMMQRIASISEYARDNNPLRALVVGSPTDGECRDVRTFLSRNRVPFEWIDPAKEVEAARLPLCTPPDLRGSFVVVDESTIVSEPLTTRKVAEALGFRTTPARTTYDVVVVGGGPAGLAAAVYGASEGLSALLVEKSVVGGQAGSSSRIENYLGFPSGISGDDLSTRALKQAVRLGSEIVMTRQVEQIERAGEGGYCLSLDGGDRVHTRAVVLATGVDWRRLEVPGLEAFVGRGVLYGAARTEATTVIGKDVFIVGGGNSAGQAAMFFSGYARSVTLLVRGAGLHLTMSQYLIDQLNQQHNVVVEPYTEVVGVAGGESLTTISTSTHQAAAQERPADALFLMIGALARTDWLPAELHRDRNGFICSGRDTVVLEGQRAPYLLETNLAGIFCAGDVRAGSIKRVASGVGEGSMAIAFVHQYLALATVAAERSRAAE